MMLHSLMRRYQYSMVALLLVCSRRRLHIVGKGLEVTMYTFPGNMYYRRWHQLMIWYHYYKGDTMRSLQGMRNHFDIG